MSDRKNPPVPIAHVSQSPPPPGPHQHLRAPVLINEEQHHGLDAVHHPPTAGDRPAPVSRAAHPPPPQRPPRR